MIFDTTKRKGGGTIVPKTINANGVYNAAADNADGYSPVTVNVPTGIQPPATGWMPSEFVMQYGYYPRPTKIVFYGAGLRIGNYEFRTAQQINSRPFAFNTASVWVCDKDCTIAAIGTNAWYYQPAITTLKLRLAASCSMGSYLVSGASVSSVYLHADSVSSSINIDSSAFAGASYLTDIYVSWGEGEVAGAPWGATNATIHYNYTED